MFDKIKNYLLAGSLFFAISAKAADVSEFNSKAKELVSKMTLDEKLDIIHGNGFNIAAVKRLGISAVNVSDASMGIRITPWPHCKGKGPSTAFPSTLLLAATWDSALGAKYAKAVAEEFRARNIHILLGPGVNIYRNPLCGRNYEYMGEDPYLVSQMVAAYVKSVQKVGCLTTVKHFVANQSEPKRKISNSVVSERALREIYFPAFKASVEKGGTLGIMNAYNLLNGTYCGENKWLLKNVLRDEWGFNGFVMSDWESLWHSELAANSGVDIEMPGGRQTFALKPETVKKMLKDGRTTQEEIDSKVFHIVRACLAMGFYDKNWAKPELNKLDEHAKIALDTARAGMVLLKNDKLLPLSPDKVKKVVVIGPAAILTATTGGGSGHVEPNNPVNLLEGIKKIYGEKTVFLPKFDKDKISDADAVFVCVGYNTLIAKKFYDGVKRKLSSIAEEQAAFNTNNSGNGKLDHSEHEGNDRQNYHLPKGDDQLIAKCAEANPNTAVLIVSGGGVAMPWIDKVKSVLWTIYGGQNGSIAAGEILAGKVNPSGKLPITISKSLEDLNGYGDIGMTWDGNGKPVLHKNLEHWNIPYNKKKDKSLINEPIKYYNVVYKEGIFVGYRYFDKNNIAPQFPFGHGLSYTTFKFGKPEIKVSGKDVKVTFTVTNTGSREGAEVAQLYVHDVKCSVPRPPKELKGFKKVNLQPGETKTVEISLDNSSFSFWNPETKKWTMEPGEFKLLIGASSRDIRQTVSVTLK